jgi:hypothetical protein
MKILKIIIKIFLNNFTNFITMRFLILFFIFLFSSCVHEISHVTTKFNEWCNYQHQGKPMVKSIVSSTNFDSIQKDFLISYKSSLIDYYSQFEEFNKIKQKIIDNTVVTDLNNHLYVTVVFDKGIIDLHKSYLSIKDSKEKLNNLEYCIIKFIKIKYDTLSFVDGFGNNETFNLKSYRDEYEQKSFDFLKRK